MPECYALLSKSVPSPLGGYWVADESISDRLIKRGTMIGIAEIENVHDAAKVFADLLAEKEFGESYSALLVSSEMHLPNGAIFEMQAGTSAPGGGHYVMEPLRFAVMVNSKP